MKDHEIAQLVNALRDCAVEFHAAQQLRERIAALVVPALRGRRSPDRQQDAARYLWLRDNADKWLGSPKVVCGPMGDQCFTAGAAMDRDIDAAIESAAALQQSSSGITAGAAKPSQVVDFGAAAQTRTGDLLITNQNEKAPETSQNQDVTPKTAPAQPAHATPTESIGCEGVTAGQWSPDVLNGVANALALAAWLPANQDKKGSELQSAAFTLFGRALVAAARSFWHGSGEPIAWLRDPPASGCEGVTAALDVIRLALQDASRLVGAAAETHPKLCRLARDSLLKAHVAWHEISAQWAERDNFRWITIAHTLCTDAGVPSGHIADRLEALRAVLESHL